VVVVSEETAGISVVMAGDMVRELDAPRLRVMLHEILRGETENLGADTETGERAETPAMGSIVQDASASRG
jgi:hypothetical protein